MKNFTLYHFYLKYSFPKKAIYDHHKKHISIDNYKEINCYDSERVFTYYLGLYDKIGIVMGCWDPMGSRDVLGCFFFILAKYGIP